MEFKDRHLHQPATHLGCAAELNIYLAAVPYKLIVETAVHSSRYQEEVYKVTNT